MALRRNLAASLGCVSNDELITEQLNNQEIPNALIFCESGWSAGMHRRDEAGVRMLRSSSGAACAF